MVCLPCIGPSLVTALSLVSIHPLSAASLLATFVLAASLPLLVISYGARYWVMQYHKTVAQWTYIAQPIIGITLFCFGLIIIMGWDRMLLAWITQSLPMSWLTLISRY